MPVVYMRSWNAVFELLLFSVAWLFQEIAVWKRLLLIFGRS